MLIQHQVYGVSCSSVSSYWNKVDEINRLEHKYVLSILHSQLPLPIETLGTNFSEILLEILTFAFKKMC